MLVFEPCDAFAKVMQGSGLQRARVSLIDCQYPGLVSLSGVVRTEDRGPASEYRGPIPLWPSVDDGICPNIWASDSTGILAARNFVSVKSGRSLRFGKPCLRNRVPRVLRGWRDVAADTGSEQSSGHA